ncbi:hypothetical protein [Nocardioides panacisoli]|uniref:Uncharacterized protein n=1 Tax=Nocardioides panacisoli TaxID=627624 RepID=A0ABP7HSD8_9ACTN
MSTDRDLVAAEGVAPNGDSWAVLYRAETFGARHYVALVVNGGVQEDGAGWEITGRTEIGFAGGFTPGVGNRYLYGLVTSRIATVRAECRNERDQSEVATEPFPAAKADDGRPLRTFVLVRPPIDDVIALVGLDGEGQVVQRIALPGVP